MPVKYFKKAKFRVKDAISDQTRKKLGVTQAQLAAVLGVSRSYITLAESKQRNLNSKANTLVADMYLQFHELETGKQATYRSLETRLFLNEIYKKKLPEMLALEKHIRFKGKALSVQMQAMKEEARDSENAIIVFTTALTALKEKDNPDEQGQRMITGLELFKQQAYHRLLTCWEPEQAKLRAKIEALAGEARALRSYRLKIIKEHLPSTRKKPPVK